MACETSWRSCIQKPFRGGDSIKVAPTRSNTKKGREARRRLIEAYSKEGHCPDCGQELSEESGGFDLDHLKSIRLVNSEFGRVRITKPSTEVKNNMRRAGHDPGEFLSSLSLRKYLLDELDEGRYHLELYEAVCHECNNKRRRSKGPDDDQPDAA